MPEVQSAIRSFGKCKLGSGVRTWNCAGPGTASNLVLEASDGCILRRCPCRFRICRQTRA
eukprot:6284268-Alexandrium_andersonii.AAC.1